MTLNTTRPLTLHDVITQGSDIPADLDDYLNSKIRESDKIMALPPSTRRSIDGQLRAAVDGALRHDLVAVLAAGWQVSSALREAAHRTATTPDVTELVDLVRQTITQDVRPSVRVYLDRDLIVTVEIEIIAQAAFRDLCAVVREGALVAIDFGECVAKVSIRTSSGMPLTERQLTLTSNKRLGLPRPITLVTPTAR
jgi:hypothetical protein